MTNLDPDAQAVYDAAHAADSMPAASLADAIAAALRAAADQGRRGPEHWEGSHPDDFDKGWDAAMDWVANIALELDPVTPTNEENLCDG